MSTPDTVDAYIASFPPEVADRLARVRGILADRLAGGKESIRYGMAAVMLEPAARPAPRRVEAAHRPLPRAGVRRAAGVGRRPVPFQQGHGRVPPRPRAPVRSSVGRICDAIVEDAAAWAAGRRPDPPAQWWAGTMCSGSRERPRSSSSTVRWERRAITSPTPTETRATRPPQPNMLARAP